MDGFRIDVSLLPLADVQAWGDPASGLSRHWFGLTDDWYDVIIGEQRLYSRRGETRGIDDPVVRLWEDLIEMAPAALEPVSGALASRLADFARATWFRRAFERPRYGEGRGFSSRVLSSRVLSARVLGARVLSARVLSARVLSARVLSSAR